MQLKTPYGKHCKLIDKIVIDTMVPRYRILLIILFTFWLLLKICIGVTFAYSAESMQFKVLSTGGNCSHCTWISAEGTITKETVRNFEKLLERNDFLYGTIIAINSHGGDLFSALRLGELFRKIKADVWVGKTLFDASGNVIFQDSLPSGITPVDFNFYYFTHGECYSACAYAFLGGESRNISKDSRFGVHQFFVDKALSEVEKKSIKTLNVSSTQFVSAILLEYVMRMGVNPRLVTLASQTPPNMPIRLLNSKELYELQVDNSIPLPGVWRIEPKKEGVIALIEQTQMFFGRRNQVISAEVFCKKGNKRKPILLIREKLSASVLTLDWIREPQKRQELFEHVTVSINGSFNTEDQHLRVLSTSLERTSKSGMMLVSEIALSEKVIKQLIDPNSHFFFIRSTGPNFTWPVLSGRFPLDNESAGAAKMIAFALNYYK